MTDIQNLNKLEKKLVSFGVKPQPKQTSKGEISLPIRYLGEGFRATLTCVGGKPIEEWWGQCNPTVRRRVREHFNAFLAVDAF